MTLCAFVKDSVGVVAAVIAVLPWATWATSLRGTPAGERASGGSRRIRRLREEKHQTRRRPAAAEPALRSQAHEVGAVVDFVTRQIRTTCRVRTRRGDQRAKSQQPWCMKGVRTESAHPPDELGKKLRGSGCAGSSAEAVATLGPTSLQDCPAGSRGHAGTKTVFAGLATIVRLKSALHGVPSQRALPGGARYQIGVPAPAARDELSTG